MGLYQVNCSQCGKSFAWFSGNASDQRCNDCSKKGKTMTLEQALLKIIELQQQILDLQKKQQIQPQTPQTPIFTPPTQTLYDLCSDGGLHEYPNPWMGIVPPSCKKCGKQSLTYTAFGGVKHDL